MIVSNTGYVQFYREAVVASCLQGCERSAAKQSRKKSSIFTGLPRASRSQRRPMGRTEQPGD